MHELVTCIGEVVFRFCSMRRNDTFQCAAILCFEEHSDCRAILEKRIRANECHIGDDLIKFTGFNLFGIQTELLLDSVANGLNALASGASSSEGASSSHTEGLVAIHDTARPLVRDALIRRGIELAAQHGAAIAGARVSDTIKRVNEDGSIRETIDRDTLRAVQTPQVFQRALLERAHSENAASDSADATDDAMLVEAIGQTVYVYESDAGNLKITTPHDLVVAETLLAKLLSERLAGSRQ